MTSEDQQDSMPEVINIFVYQDWLPFFEGEGLVWRVSDHKPDGIVGVETSEWVSKDKYDRLEQTAYESQNESTKLAFNVHSLEVVATREARRKEQLKNQIATMRSEIRTNLTREAESQRRHDAWRDDVEEDHNKLKELFREMVNAPEKHAGATWIAKMNSIGGGKI